MPKKNDLIYPTDKKSSRMSPMTRVETAPPQKGLANFTRFFVHWRNYLFLIPLLLVILTSANTLVNDFVYDDTIQVLENPQIKVLGNIPQFFTRSVWSFRNQSVEIASLDSYYRPVFLSLFAVTYSLFGEQAWGWHVINLLIHLAVTLFVFLVCKELFQSILVACLAASLFAIHPIHTESVAWISGVTDPLMALFALAAFYCYLRFISQGKRYLFGIAVLLYLLALFSKETAVMLPVIIVFYELFYSNQAASFRLRVRRAAILCAVFAAPTVLYFLMRQQALGRVIVGEFNKRFEWGYVILTLPTAFLKYLYLMVVPVCYSIIHYLFPVTSPVTFRFLAPVALLIAILIGIYKSKSRGLLFASLWFAIWLVPSFGGIRVFSSRLAIQERYLYLPSIGFCVAIALGLQWLLAQRANKPWAFRIVCSVALVFCLMLSLVTWQQNAVWKTTVSLFENAAQCNQDLPIARTELATIYYRAKRYKDAEREINKALELDPTFVDAYIQKSQIAYNEKKLDEAMQYIQQAQTYVKDDLLKERYLARVCLEAAFLYGEQKQFDLQEQYLRQAVDYLPYPLTWDKLGDFYFARKRYEEARQMYELVVTKVSDDFAPIHYKLARTYDALQLTEQAKAEYQTFLNLSPESSEERSEVLRRLLKLQ